jgi:hypothetical protein
VQRTDKCNINKPDPEGEHVVEAEPRASAIKLAVDDDEALLIEEPTEAFMLFSMGWAKAANAGCLRTCKQVSIPNET